MLPQTSWIHPAEPPALECLAEGGRSKNKTMVSGELTIKKVPEVGALRGTEIFEGNEVSFLLFWGFFLNEHALKPFMNG